jgi:hypothetical protein
VKLALGLAASAVLSIGAMGGFVAWRHAHPGTYERELAWIESYVQWRSEIDDALDNGDTETVLRCERRLLELTGSASTATLVELQLAALGGCRSLRSEIYAAGGDELEDRVYDDWYATRYTMIGGLGDERERTAQPTRSPLLAKHVAPYAGTMPVVLCWPEREWRELSEEWSLLKGDEFPGIAGFADPEQGRIHLEPRLCDLLKRFFGGNYAPNLNEDSAFLAEGLVALAHEAEHLHRPEASEAEVECVALQHVRELVRGAGRPPSYEELMAGLAWDVEYPAMIAEYQIDTCHDGGALDLRPRSDVWP